MSTAFNPAAFPTFGHAFIRPDFSLPPEASAARLKILLVDDHPITRQGLKVLINLQANLRVCAEADSAEAALVQIEEHKPDLAIVDITLKASNGIDLTKQLRAKVPQMPILIVSMHDEGVYAERALRAGAMGYLMKQEAGEKVVEAIQRLLKGELYVSARIKEKMLHRATQAKPDSPAFAIDSLSDREMEVFQLIGNGYATKQIAQKLNLSSKTIDSYREHLKEKLNLATGPDLVQYAIQWARDGGAGSAGSAASGAVER